MITGEDRYVYFNYKLRRIVPPNLELQDIFNQLRLFILTDVSERPFSEGIVRHPEIKRYLFEPNNPELAQELLYELQNISEEFLRSKKIPPDILSIQSIQFSQKSLEFSQQSLEESPPSIVFNITHRGAKRSVEIKTELLTRVS